LRRLSKCSQWEAKVFLPINRYIILMVCYLFLFYRLLLVLYILSNGYRDVIQYTALQWGFVTSASTRMKFDGIWQLILFKSYPNLLKIGTNFVFEEAIVVYLVTNNGYHWWICHLRVKNECNKDHEPEPKILLSIHQNCYMH
jgi:hypothetical protein